MKTIFLWMTGLLLSVATFAQSIVTVNVQGARNSAVVIDGQSYDIADDIKDRQPLVITGLSAGRHTIELVRNNQVNTTSSAFNVRSGYDLAITVRNNGTFTMRETKSKGMATTYNPMTNSSFQTLLRQIHARTGQTNKANAVAAAFNTVGNYFTSDQTRQLISIVNSQATRLTIAKNAFHRVTDPANYSLVYDLINSQAGRNELMAYVNSYYKVGSGSGSVVHNQGKTPMTATTFASILDEARNQWQSNLRVNYLLNVFANVSNFFTAAQARQLIELVPEEPNRLLLAKTAYRGITDVANLSMLYNILNSQSSRNELASFVSAYNVNNTNSGNVSYKTPMTDAAYTALYNEVQSTWGIGAKMTSLANIFANTAYYFTTAQAEQLIRLVSSESNRLQLAKSAYARVTDPLNYSQLYDVLSSSSSRNQLEQYVRNYDLNNGAVTSAPYRPLPMTDATYNELYSQVANTWGFGAKMNSLTQIFSNEAYYFTSAQAKRLIQLVSSESNRLQLAKASYLRIVDPESFSTIYEVLESQSSRNELADYVNSIQ